MTEKRRNFNVQQLLFYEKKIGIYYLLLGLMSLFISIGILMLMVMFNATEILPHNILRTGSENSLTYKTIFPKTRFARRSPNAISAVGQPQKYFEDIEINLDNESATDPVAFLDMPFITPPDDDNYQEEYIQPKTQGEIIFKPKNMIDVNDQISDIFDVGSKKINKKLNSKNLRKYLTKKNKKSRYKTAEKINVNNSDETKTNEGKSSVEQGKTNEIHVCDKENTAQNPYLEFYPETNINIQTNSLFSTTKSWLKNDLNNLESLFAPILPLTIKSNTKVTTPTTQSTQTFPQVNYFWQQPPPLNKLSTSQQSKLTDYLQLTNPAWPFFEHIPKYITIQESNNKQINQPQFLPKQKLTNQNYYFQENNFPQPIGLPSFTYSTVSPVYIKQFLHSITTIPKLTLDSPVLYMVANYRLGPKIIEAMRNMDRSVLNYPPRMQYDLYRMPSEVKSNDENNYNTSVAKFDNIWRHVRKIAQTDIENNESY